MAAIKSSTGTPAELNISHVRNDSIDGLELTITNKVTGTPINLSVYTDISMQIKLDPNSDTVLLEFSKALGSIKWELDAGGVEIGTGSNGKIVLLKSSTEMSTLDVNSYYYDIQFSSGTRRNTLIFGRFIVYLADTTR